MSVANTEGSIAEDRKRFRRRERMRPDVLRETLIRGLLRDGFPRETIKIALCVSPKVITRIKRELTGA